MLNVFLDAAVREVANRKNTIGILDELRDIMLKKKPQNDKMWTCVFGTKSVFNLLFCGLMVWHYLTLEDTAAMLLPVSQEDSQESFIPLL